eukprot:546900-Prorocentrum_minimum.AAC.4
MASSSSLSQKGSEPPAIVVCRATATSCAFASTCDNGARHGVSETCHYPPLNFSFTTYGRFYSARVEPRPLT